MNEKFTKRQQADRARKRREAREEKEWEPEEIRRDREAVQKASNKSGSFSKAWKSAKDDSRFEELTERAHKLAYGSGHDMKQHGEGKPYGKR